VCVFENTVLAEKEQRNTASSRRLNTVGRSTGTKWVRPRYCDRTTSHHTPAYSPPCGSFPSPAWGARGFAYSGSRFRRRGYL